MRKEIRTLQDCYSVLSGVQCSQGAAMHSMATESFRQKSNRSKPPCQSVVHFTKMLADSEAKLARIDEQIADLGAKRQELQEKRL
eukprot:13251461-Alexandrium_andersonii.AAC.1